MATKQAKKRVTLSDIQDLQIEERSVYVTWRYKDNDNHTDKFEYTWQYSVQNVWIQGSSGSVECNNITPKQCSYSYPEGAEIVRVFVRPVSKKKPKNKGNYFESGKSKKTRVVSKLLPDEPSPPSVTIENHELTAKVTITDPNAVLVEFEFVNAETGAAICNPIQANIIAQQATVKITASDGITYRSRCKAANAAGSYGPFSDYSDDTEGTTPPGPIASAPIGEAISKNAIRVTWEPSANATKYTLEYTIQERFFDAVTSLVESVDTEGETYTELYNLEPDRSIDDSGEYFFRVKAINDKSEESGWSPIGSCRIGTRPDPPTTWSSRATASPNDTIYLYWTHNSVDGSREVEAIINLTVGGVTTAITVPNETTKDEDTGTHRYPLDASTYADGADIKWTVRTRGAYVDSEDPDKTYSDVSIEREINIYAPPSLGLFLGSENRWFWDDLEFTEEASIHTTNGELVPMELNEFSVKTLTKFPFYIKLNASPINQTPVSYNISITTTESYEDIDELGNPITIRAGAEVFSRFMIRSEHEVLTFVIPADINVFDGETYVVKATLSMDSGLGAEASDAFAVDLNVADDIILDAEDIYDEERVAMSLAPYCEDEDGNQVNGISMDLYRRQSDGSFIQIASGLPSEVRTYVVDPHPNFGEQLYRIVGTDVRTGRMYFSDIFVDPIPEKSILIQWDEEIRTFDADFADSDDEIVEEPHTGTTLRLPYNVDVQDTTNPDVAFVQYIGRKHPVSYYGTHVGETATWNCEIPYEDKETISLLRRLQVWMGDVYIREPSGLGYWAQVNPSFNLEHCKVTVPVSLAITRVEGGI